ncbi:MAG TPA: ABC transporter substrate-binding protein [Pseudonocardiaceae bacterium]|jgi:NitT/TauT family transport system substrate-binding protein|nr:ABC transporter substrate-binding protein [Pseudonocardiaceae bacterium]
MRFWKSLRSSRIGAILVGVALLATAACGVGSASANNSDNLTLGLPVPATTLAAVYLADDRNLWAQHGLHVKIVTFSGDAELAKAVLSGDVDVAIGSPTGPITAAAAGQDAKVFYGGFDMPAFAWYAIPSIHNVAQGKDKNWGVTTLGSSTDLLTRYAVARAGLNPNSDIKVVQGGASAARLAAMQAGQLQVNVFTEPQTVEAQQAGYNKILDLKNLVDSYPMHVAWAGQSFVDNTDRAKRFVATLSQAMQLVHTDQNAAAVSIATHTKISVADAKASIAEWIGQLYPDGRMPSAAAMTTFWNMGISGKVFTSRLPDSKWLDTRFLPK